MSYCELNSVVGGGGGGGGRVRIDLNPLYAVVVFWRVFQTQKSEERVSPGFVSNIPPGTFCMIYLYIDIQ